MEFNKQKYSRPLPREISSPPPAPRSSLPDDHGWSTPAPPRLHPTTTTTTPRVSPPRPTMNRPASASASASTPRRRPATPSRGGALTPAARLAYAEPHLPPRPAAATNPSTTTNTATNTTTSRVPKSPHQATKSTSTSTPPRKVKPTRTFTPAEKERRRLIDIENRRLLRKLDAVSREGPAAFHATAPSQTAAREPGHARTGDVYGPTLAPPTPPRYLRGPHDKTLAGRRETEAENNRLRRKILAPYPGQAVTYAQVGPNSNPNPNPNPITPTKKNRQDNPVRSSPSIHRPLSPYPKPIPNLSYRSRAGPI